MRWPERISLFRQVGRNRTIATGGLGDGHPAVGGGESRQRVVGADPSSRAPGEIGGGESRACGVACGPCAEDIRVA
jgi:hypothetical protein